MEPTPRPVEPQGLFDGLRFGPIAVGAVFDQFLTMVAIALLIGWFVTPEVGSEDSEAAEAALEAVLSSSTFLAASMVVGFACTTVAAWFGARMAGRDFVRHGGWIAVTSAALAAVFVLGAADQPSRIEIPLAYEVAGWLLMLPAGLLGGAFAGLTAPRAPAA